MVYIATGNCLQKVSYSAWDDGIHGDRKLFAKGFLFGVGSMVYDRKLCAKGFLYGMRRMLFIETGNFPFLCYNIRRY